MKTLPRCGCFLSLITLLICASAQADTLLPPSRVGPFDWECQDAAGVKISDHQRVDLAIINCLNDPKGAFVQGGRYKINRAAVTPPVTPPPVVPPPVTPPTSTGSATLTWTAPVLNVDNTPLTDLAGYTLWQRCNSGPLASIDIGPALTSYIASNLPAGSCSWNITASNSKGDKSAASNSVSKTIN